MKRQPESNTTLIGGPLHGKRIHMPFGITAASFSFSTWAPYCDNPIDAFSTAFEYNVLIVAEGRQYLRYDETKSRLYFDAPKLLALPRVGISTVIPS